jgi:hypothetical protein
VLIFSLVICADSLYVCVGLRGLGIFICSQRVME